MATSAAGSRQAVRAGQAILLGLILGLLVAGPLHAQGDEAPKESREKRLVSELRAGNWELKTVEQLVRALIENKERHAARWWTQVALGAAERDLLPPETGKSLALIAKQGGLKPSEPQLRAMPTRAIKHLEKVMKARCYAAAPEAIHFARRCLETYPDETMVAEVDAIERSLEGLDRSDERPVSPVITKSAAKLVEQLGEARDELLDDMIGQYEAYPCPPGARAIRALILARGEESVSAEWRATFDRLTRLEFDSEPKRTVRIWFENGGKVEVWRHGMRLMGEHGRSTIGEKRQQGLAFEVIAGDLIQFEVEKPHAKKLDRLLFVVAAAAELDGRALPSTAWFQNANGRVSSIDPQLNPMCRGIPFSPGEVPDGLVDEVEQQVRALGAGILFPTADEFHHYAVDRHKNLSAAEEAIRAAGQTPTWIGGEGERLIVVLRIPR